MELSKTISEYILEKEKNGEVMEFNEDGRPTNVKYEFLKDCSDMDDIRFNIRREIIDYQDHTGIVISDSIDESTLVEAIFNLLNEELSFGTSFVEDDYLNGF